MDSGTRYNSGAARYMDTSSGKFIAFETEAKIRLRLDRLRKAIERAREGSLRPIGFIVSQIAKGKVKKSAVASPPGQPPHTRRGRLKFAIRYQMAQDKRSIVIGPAASKLGIAHKPHEFGGQYKGGRFPERPLMGPALEEAQSMIGPAFARKFRTQFG